MSVSATRGFFAMMDDGLRIPHSAMRHHFFDVLHQTIALLLQTSTGWLRCACGALVRDKRQPRL
jgi:hypothetical protein